MDVIRDLACLLLTACGFGGVLRPLLISRVIDVTGSYTLVFYIIAAIMVGSAVVAFAVRLPSRGSDVTASRRGRRVGPVRLGIIRRGWRCVCRIVAFNRGKEVPIDKAEEIPRSGVRLGP